MVHVDTAVRCKPRPIAATLTKVARRRTGAGVENAAEEAVPGGGDCDASSTCDELLRACAAGDRAAFEHLYQQTSARLFAAVRRLIWNKSEAEEVLQEVYIKIWRGASAYDPGQASSLTWMLRVARNHAIDHLRRGAARRAHELVTEGDLLHEGDEIQYGTSIAIDGAPRPDEWLEIQQDQKRFDALIGSLGEMQRQVVLLAFRDGFTHADIAEKLDAPIGSVKSWMWRALQRLKTTIDAEAECSN